MVCEISMTSWWSSSPNSRATSASLRASIMIEAFSAPLHCSMLAITSVMFATPG